MKICDVCQKEIPQNYNNLLCDECYVKIEEENKRIQEVDKEEKFEQAETVGQLPISSINIDTVVVSTEELANAVEEKPSPEDIKPKKHDSSILDENYEENPEMEDKEQWEANLRLFIDHDLLLWHPTRHMYTFIKDYCLGRVQQHPQFPKYIWRPKIVDVGCGSGVGSNVLSQEADFVWGIDKNEKSIKFAQEAFTRLKNGIYYSGECKFDHIDIVKDTRTFMHFDVVCAIEIIEHIDDWRTFVKNLIQKFDNRSPHTPTEYFISTPNRNNKSIRKDRPYNRFHCREWTQEEMELALGNYFTNIEFYNSKGEPVGDKNDHTPLLAKCSIPKI